MKKMTFCKLVDRIRKLNTWYNESYAYLYREGEQVQDIKKMMIQALEEDTNCAWEPRFTDDLLNSEKPAEELYDEIMQYSYRHCCNYGMRLQEMLYSGAVDHNALVGIWEKDEKEPHYSNRVWKGMFWELPEEYKDRIGQVHSILSDGVSESDIVNIELREKLYEDA